MLERLNLVPDWSKVLTKAWSIRLLVIGAVFQILELIWPALEPMLGLPPLTIKTLTAVITVGAIYARLYSQKVFK